ncbi:MAG: hypothetical protein OXG13_13450 [Gemmatimonadaceae bacterium]|nr:hypothetical protein [Gemmatimonadaceae bacterium]
MPTKIGVPDHLLRRAEAAASLQGKSLEDFVTEALEEKVGSAVGRGPGRRLRFPLVPSDRPGSVNLGSDDIAGILESEDSGASGGL